jgi:hypothetical protein
MIYTCLSIPLRSCTLLMLTLESHDSKRDKNQLILHAFEKTKDGLDYAGRNMSKNLKPKTDNMNPRR